MKAAIKPGKYVVAVSGGVDSVTLLDMLASRPDVSLVVAHFDHGIRPDSHQDRLLVATLSQKYQLLFEYAEGHLGCEASEEQARQARYKFLQQIRNKHKAEAIITAHHQDDALETLAFNVLRGTRRKGLSSLRSTDEVVRPLIDYSKQDIIDYARTHKLQWREDSTNQNEKYTRNWIRRRLLPKLSRKQKQALTEVYNTAKLQNSTLDRAVQQQLDELRIGKGLDRKKFISLPYSVACEVMAAWIRENSQIEIDHKLVDVLTVAVKTVPSGKRMSVGTKAFLHIGTDALTVG